MPIKNDKITSYIRVGSKYYKDVFKPDKNSRKHRILIEWSRQSIIDDFDDKALGRIVKYNGFIRVPSHIDYKSEIEGFYNQYFDIGHEPVVGEFPTIMQILNHVFQKHINFGLDYFKLLYEKPNQRLPILVFESTEKNTGKSTLGDLLCLIFLENAIQLGNADFENQFSGFWLNKLCVIVDETSLNQKGIMATVKRLSTANGQITSNEKNKAQTQIDYFGKFIFMSNEEGRALPIERGEDRFAVFKVPTFEATGIKKIPNVEQLIKNEIPAFLHFLLNRKMVCKEEDRMYFKFEVYKTPQLMLYYQNSCSKIAKEIKDLLHETFEIFPEEDLLKFSIINLLNELKGTIKNLERSSLKKVIENELKITIQKRSRYTYYSRLLFEKNSEYQPKRHGENNTYYEFSRTEFGANLHFNDLPINQQNETDFGTNLENGTGLEHVWNKFGTTKKWNSQNLRKKWNNGTKSRKYLKISNLRCSKTVPKLFHCSKMKRKK